MTVGPDLASGQSEVDRRPVRAIDYALLMAPAFSTPLLLWAENYVGVGHPERLILIGALVWVVSAIALGSLRFFDGQSSAPLATVWVAAYLFMSGGALIHTLGYLWGTLLLALAIAITQFLVSRRSRRGLRLIVALASCLLVVEVLLAWSASYSSLGDDITSPPPPELHASLAIKPDVLFVVADAFIGLEGLEKYFDVENPSFETEFVSRGFQVPEVAYSPYPTTRSSIAAILDMGYPLWPGPGASKATIQSLYERIGGKNRLVRFLRDQGYRFTMIESGWSGSSCGAAADRCVASPFLDESTFFTLESTWVGPFVLEQYGYSFTLGALNSMAWLDSNLPGITNDGEPDFVTAHLEIPHPPFFLDERCRVDTSPNRGGTTLYLDGVELEERKAAYLEQVSCLERFLARLTDAISDDTVVIVVGDHGTDGHRQLATHPSDWSEDATRERLNVMVAFRGPSGCALTEPTVLTRVFAEVIECLARDDFVPDIPVRLFRYAAASFEGKASPIVELGEDEVRQLLGPGFP